MRLLPRSLFGRLVLVMVGGLLLAQLATAWINLAERDQLLYRAGGMRLAQQIADIVKLLDTLPAAERRRVVAVFNAPPLAVSLDAPPLPKDDEPAESDFQLSMFANVLRFALNDFTDVRIRRSAGVPQARGMGPPVGAGPPYMKGPGMHGPGMQGPGMQGPGPAGPSFRVQVALNDGSRVTFDSNVSPQAGATPARVALTLVVLLGTVILLSLVAVRWVTGPLSSLAVAAEKLGEDINRPPLPETGPVEVQRAARAFNTMQQRLSRFISDRTRILAAMSHDLKTPITRMRLRTEMLDDAAVRAKFEHDLGEMESMVAQTLEFMRDTSASEPVQRIDLAALLESLQADFQEMGKPVAIEGRAAHPYPGRPVALRRCFSNLIENAVRYGEHATVCVEESAAEITVRVRDRGPGIPEAELERSFEPFFRGEASRSRETGGTGLGLGIARNIARAHGGDLVLRNCAGGGLEAIVTLPHADAGAQG